MSVIVFDTETTGLNPGNIIQLAYVLAQDGKLTARNYYFDVDYIEPAAIGVHGITREQLAQLSGGVRFERYCDMVLREFRAADVVIAHNYAFDRAFMDAEAIRNGDEFRAKKYCTMNSFRDICKLPGKNNAFKNPKLDELIEYYHITETQIEAYTAQLFGQPGLRRHDARLDCAALALVVAEAAKQREGGLDVYPETRLLG